MAREAGNNPAMSNNGECVGNRFRKLAVWPFAAIAVVLGICRVAHPPVLGQHHELSHDAATALAQTD